MLTTKRILDAGALIGIDLLDHIIIGNNCYMSFREEGHAVNSANKIEEKDSVRWQEMYTGWTLVLMI